MFKLKVFRKQMYCVEESTCDIVRTFRAPPAVIRRPHSDSAPGNYVPLVLSSWEYGMQCFCQASNNDV